ncbi:MAG: TolB family protein, partial [Candidatus Sericytochromatia bacterium]
SPDGSKIAFESGLDFSTDIYIMNADGSNQTNLTNNALENSEPIFSPNGSKIAFISNYDIYIMNADGSNQTNLTNSPSASDYGVNFSSNGSKILFSLYEDPFGEIYEMNIDGSNKTNLTNSINFDDAPMYQP